MFNWFNRFKRNPPGDLNLRFQFYGHMIDMPSAEDIGKVLKDFDQAFLDNPIYYWIDNPCIGVRPSLLVFFMMGAYHAQKGKVNFTAPLAKSLSELRSEPQPQLEAAKPEEKPEEKPPEPKPYLEKVETLIDFCGDYFRFQEGFCTSDFSERATQNAKDMIKTLCAELKEDIKNGAQQT